MFVLLLVYVNHITFQSLNFRALNSSSYKGLACFAHQQSHYARHKGPGFTSLLLLMLPSNYGSVNRLWVGHFQFSSLYWKTLLPWEIKIFVIGTTFVHNFKCLHMALKIYFGQILLSSLYSCETISTLFLLARASL